MDLPNAADAIVEQEKIEGYLLNTAHRYAGSKARFFMQFGFRRSEWHFLARALKEHASRYPVARWKETGYGPRYEVDGMLAAPDGRSPHITSVWQVDVGKIAPRLITAYPMEQP